MTTPPPVLLVLAWDDDDPAVHRVGPADALPARPTLPLVRALAAAQPVRALLPQLPPAGANGALDAAPGPNSRLVGLNGLALALAAGPAPTAPPPPAAAPGSTAPAPAVQLRPPLAQRAPSGWQTPAAPYAGRDETPPAAPPLAPDAPAAGPAGAPAAAEGANSLARPGPPVAAGAPNPSAAPAAPAAGPPFDEPGDEMGPAEAADLVAGDLDLDLPPPAPGAVHATLTQGLAALHRPAGNALSSAPAFDLSGDANYRIIQYARFAAYVSDNDAEDIGVIYAPDWPTWLAAVEIGYRRRRPLVLHLNLLAAATAAPAERDWRLELERYALRRAHTVLVTTNALRGQVLKHYALAPNRIRVVAADDADGIRTALRECENELI